MSKKSNIILLIEDNPDDRTLIKKYLSMGGFKSWQIINVVRLSDAIETIQKTIPDIILLDLSLPDSSGIESYSRLKRNNDLIPIIVLTGLSDLSLAKELIQQGAQDYLMKGEFDTNLLEKSIDYAIERNKLKRENNMTRARLLDSVLEAQDLERGRIAKELHDGVVQSLTAVSLNLGLLRNSVSKFDERTVFHYEKCAENLSTTIDEIRNISHSLMPRSIADMSLINAIESLIGDLSEVTEINFEFLANFNAEVEEKLKITIYRIVQELINNAMKHSCAKNLIIQLLEYPEYISLMVEDDGIGFDKLAIQSEKNCFGLKSLESRVNATGGTLEVDSKPGSGTNVFISFFKGR